MQAEDELKPVTETDRGTRFVLGVLPWRLLLATLIWIVLTAGGPGSLTVGVPVILAAALASAFLLPRLPWSPRGILGFAAYFLVQSVRGGVDVARRALHPALPIDPAVIEYRFRIAGELPRVALTNTISLLPGTLGADMDDSHLYVHTLDRQRDIQGDIAIAEQRVASLFGLVLETGEGSTPE